MNWLRRKLGLPVVNDITQLMKFYDDLARARHVFVLNELSATNLALGRLVAKLDPNYIRSEESEERRVESNAIGERVIDKLKAEAKAMAHTAPRRI